MKVKPQVICAVVAAALGLAACAPTVALVTLAAGALAFNPHSESIAGEYRLTSVNGQKLPWTGSPDATGRPVTIVGGTLTLGDAAPDFYDDVGGGILLARNCVQQIPDEASVDADGIVYYPNGASDRMAGCGNAGYDLVIKRGSPDANETATGRYTWGGAATGGPTRYITLVGSRNGLVIQSGTVLIRLQHADWPDSPDNPLYEFSPAP